MNLKGMDLVVKENDPYADMFAFPLHLCCLATQWRQQLRNFIVSSLHCHIVL